jgi:predicted lipid-binding transport protein (Tim44 family)
MKRALLAIFVAFMALSMSLGEASAKRLGGGRSVGVQRQAVAPKPAAPMATPASPMAPAGAVPAAPKRNWLGPLAGLAAGIGLAALFSHFGMGEGMANFAMIALLAMAAFFVIRLLLRRKAADPAQSMQYAGAGAGGAFGQPPVQREGMFQAGGVAAPAAAATAAINVPAGFDTEGFVRIAKLNFVRLQAANDAKNLDDMREFTSPELFAEIKLQMDERGNAPQQTDVVMLNAELLEVTTEGNRHIASVRFSGLIREEAGAAPAQFEEVWNLIKPVEGDKGWTIAGIQQVN